MVFVSLEMYLNESVLPQSLIVNFILDILIDVLSLILDLQPLTGNAVSHIEV